MSAAHPLAEIDLAFAKGEWWMRLFDMLSDACMSRVEALTPTAAGGRGSVVGDFSRLAHAVRLAVVAAMRLDVILRGLADLRRLAPEAIAAARARAVAVAAQIAAAREEARARRDARRAEREARAEEAPKRETSDRDRPDPRDRDPVVEALGRSLTVDPAAVDFDTLPLRRTVERICAALGVKPDWSRWEAGDWTLVGPAAKTASSSSPQSPPAPRPRPAKTPPWPIGRRAGPPRRTTDTAVALALSCGPGAPAWPPFRLE